MTRRSGPGPGLWLALGVLACAPPPETPAPRHLLLVSIDTLRADQLGLYGYPLRTSPNLDAFAEEAVVFDDAQATSSWTLPSHASLLTGLYPHHHGIRRNRRRMDDRVATLAEALSAAGFRTRALISAVYLLPQYGLDQGFDDYVPLIGEMERQGTASRLTDEALRWLRAEPERRSFLFLHYYDVHSDYKSLPRFERMFAPTPGRYEGKTLELLRLTRQAPPIDPEDVAHLRLLYDAGIRQLDEELGRLFDGLRRDGFLDDAVVVVTSDHGEEFHEHGGFLHGRTHHREQIQIPLLFRVPGLASRRVAEPVSLVDVMPTVLPLLGLPGPPDTDGRDLGPVLRGAPGAGERSLVAEGGPGNHRDNLRSVRRGRFKLIVDRQRGWRQLYDVTADPGEQRDVSAEHPDVLSALDAEIEAFDARAAEASPALELEPKLREHLRALGYEE